jgi:hypothetical protein
VVSGLPLFLTLPQFRRSFYTLLISLLGDSMTASMDASDVC